MQKVYSAIDLFAGIGGIRLGFQQAFGDRINFIFANDIDENCSITYQKNFDDLKGDYLEDIRNINITEIPDFDILLAGFPCQPFSKARRTSMGEHQNQNLFFSIKKILKRKKPIVFFLENVPTLHFHDNGRTFRIIKEILDGKLGYYLHVKNLNSCNFGLPQKRNRIYIIGFKRNLKFTFPRAQKNNLTIKSILEKNVHNKYYLSQRYLNTLQKHKKRHRSKKDGFGFEILTPGDIANTIVAGGMGKERNLLVDKIKYDYWKPGDNFSKKNNLGIRRMTEREFARLQGFPEEFSFPVPMTQTYRQIANSVPIPVVKAIAKEINKSLDENICSKNQYPRFQREISYYIKNKF